MEASPRTDPGRVYAECSRPLVRRYARRLVERLEELRREVVREG